MYTLYTTENYFKRPVIKIVVVVATTIDDKKKSWHLDSISLSTIRLTFEGLTFLSKEKN